MRHIRMHLLSSTVFRREKVPHCRLIAQFGAGRRYERTMYEEGSHEKVLGDRNK